MNNNTRVAAIVVTKDRLNYLKKCVEALKNQNRKPDEIIVINNASNDGTEKWLEEQEGITVIHQENLGSSGGQWRGIREAYQKNHDWFWCMDDDTIPESDALKAMLVTKEASLDSTGLLCSMVKWTNGDTHNMNIPNADFDRLLYKVWNDNNFREAGILPISSCSFVSVLIARRAVEEVGLPLKEFFIWLDDAEFTLRISSSFHCYQVIKSIALHDTVMNTGADLGNLNEKSVFKFKHYLRNQTYMLLKKKRSIPGKAFVIIGRCKFFFQNVIGKVGFESTMVLLRYMLWGFIFNPKIDFPDNKRF